MLDSRQIHLARCGGLLQQLMAVMMMMEGL